MVSFSSSSTNVNFYNNTIIGPAEGTGGRPLAGVAWLNGPSGGIVENNIFKNLPIGIARYLSSGGSMMEDFNIFDTDVGSDTSGPMTHGGHSQTNTDPGFVSSSSITTAEDVKLQAGARAIGAGTPLGSTLGLILGSAAISVPYGTYDQSTGVWMAGAFGPPGILPPPVLLTIKGARVVGGTVVPQ
jgi:hypothetical protein